MNEEDVRAYVDATKLKTERERMENKVKTGVELKGVQAINPLSKEQVAYIRGGLRPWQLWHGRRHGCAGAR